MTKVFAILHRWPSGLTSVMPTAFSSEEKAKSAITFYQKVEEELTRDAFSDQGHTYKIEELKVE